MVTDGLQTFRLLIGCCVDDDRKQIFMLQVGGVWRQCLVWRTDTWTPVSSCRCADDGRFHVGSERGPHVRDQMTEELIGLSVSVCSGMTAGIYSNSWEMQPLKQACSSEGGGLIQTPPPGDPWGGLNY